MIKLSEAEKLEKFIDNIEFTGINSSTLPPTRGLRLNKNKLRYELLPPKALKRVAEVYTKGAEKYTIRDEYGAIKVDGGNNWREGMPYMETMGSVQRHIESWKEGEDIDSDLGTHHLANAIFGLLALIEFQEIHSNLDDRPYKV